jgi:aminoglycoside phosphotransferase (APT) family kinase protein
MTSSRTWTVRSPASSDDLVHVVDVINERHGMQWSLNGRLDGGYLQGAYELRGPRDAHAVLKWHPRGISEAQLQAAARAIEDIRGRGWPTAKWLAHGVLPTDASYILEEFVPGTAAAQLSGAGLEQLLRANQLQAGLAPKTEQDWSAYIHSVVFDDAADLVTRMRARPATAALLQRLQHLTEEARSLRLPVTDLVHGDFVLRNMLLSEGSLRIIDTAHLGKGTRAYDLAALLLETTVEDRWLDPEIGPRRLEEECLSIIGRSGLLLCLVGRMLHLLAFGDDWERHDLSRLAARCGSFIERYETP